MQEWDEVEIQTVSDGLDASPRELHASFEITGDHLAEVRDRHTMMLVASGELPESHIAEIAPERRLDWMIEELNGRKFSDGLSIPLHGADDSIIELSRGEIEGHSILRLKVGSDFERKLPLPKDIESIDATLEDGILNVRW
ncbi:MAG: Hsp20/alpha crystallin family protein [Candidatus Poseidoniaceae archaeon]|jgi:hypothetical protein|nr:Hsp20/alpha crystallin family protein [Candidatus Poseidoniaceae archaeon]